jgi:hypothetical protein
MFHEEWFDDDAQLVLAGLVSSLTVPGIVLEIGAWEGRSTLALAQNTDREIHVCDTWEGCATDGSDVLARKRDVFAVWSDNLADYPNVYPHRMGWRDYVPTITKRVALCFIDAEHTFTEVFDNIRAVLPLVPRGGIMCGDDIGNREVKRACTRALGLTEAFGPIWVWRKTR